MCVCACCPPLRAARPQLTPSRQPYSWLFSAPLHSARRPLFHCTPTVAVRSGVGTGAGPIAHCRNQECCLISPFAKGTSPAVERSRARCEQKCVCVCACVRACVYVCVLPGGTLGPTPASVRLAHLAGAQARPLVRVFLLTFGGRPACHCAGSLLPVLLYSCTFALGTCTAPLLPLHAYSRSRLRRQHWCETLCPLPRSTASLNLFTAKVDVAARRAFSGPLGTKSVCVWLCVCVCSFVARP